MQKRFLLIPAVPLALAACGDTPLQAPAATPAAAAISPDDGPPNRLAVLPPARLQDLAVAVSDAELRLLPAIESTLEEATAASLRVALQRVSERLAASDPAGVLAAVAEVEAALAALPAGQAEELGAELDPVRLMLSEMRASAGVPEGRELRQ
jgi:hypothetical protein